MIISDRKGLATLRHNQAYDHFVGGDMYLRNLTSAEAALQ